MQPCLEKVMFCCQDVWARIGSCCSCLFCGMRQLAQDDVVDHSRVLDPKNSSALATPWLTHYFGRSGQEHDAWSGISGVYGKATVGQLLRLSENHFKEALTTYSEKHRSDYVPESAAEVLYTTIQDNRLYRLDEMTAPVPLMLMSQFVFFGTMAAYTVQAFMCNKACPAMGTPLVYVSWFALAVFVVHLYLLAATGTWARLTYAPTLKDPDNPGPCVRSASRNVLYFGLVHTALSATSFVAFKATDNDVETVDAVAFWCIVAEQVFSMMFFAAYRTQRTRFPGYGDEIGYKKVP